jgi:hypothetical protein
VKLSDEPEMTVGFDATNGFEAAEGGLEINEAPGIWR